MLLCLRRKAVRGFWRLRSRKLFFPITRAASRMRSLWSRASPYLHLVAISLKCISTCFMHMGSSYNSPILQSRRMSYRMSKSLRPILRGSFEHILRYFSMACSTMASSPMVRDLFLPVPYISLNPFSISLSWQMRELEQGIYGLLSAKGRQISLLSSWLRQSFQARMVLGFTLRSLPKTCLQTASDWPLIISYSRNSLLLNFGCAFSSSGFDWMSKSSEVTELSLFLECCLRLWGARGLMGVTSRELRKLLTPSRLELEDSLADASS